jgi:hypothetical protein
MEQREFEALVDTFGTTARQLVDLVEQARYEQPTAQAISNLLDARERLLVLIGKLPALRLVPAPDIAAPTMPTAAQIEQAKAALRASPDSTATLALAQQAVDWFAALVSPLQAAGRWPKTRGR